MNFNDKFLNVCFKVGKVLFSFLLVVALLTCIVMLCKTIGNSWEISNTKLKYKYDVTRMVQEEFAVLEESNPPLTDKKLEKKDNALDIKIKEFTKKQNLSTSLTNELLEKVSQIDAKDQDLFFDNFVKFYNSYMEESFRVVAKKENIPDNKLADFEKEFQAYAKQIANETLGYVYNKYLQAYNEEKISINNLRQTLEAKRNLNFISFLISLGVFILCLFLPILIRIEENTRK